MATTKRQRIPSGSKLLENPRHAAALEKRKANPDLDEGDEQYDADLAAHKESIEQLDKKYRGTHTYQLTEPHYRLGIMYVKGELVTVTDEVPGKTWKRVSADIETYQTPTALQDPHNVDALPKQLDENGKEVVLPIVTRIEVASQGREIPGVKSENAEEEAKKKAAQEMYAAGSNVKPTDKKK